MSDESELSGVVAPQLTAAELKQQKAELIRREKEEIGGPTLFINRYFVQPYPEGGFRITFGEQFTGNLDVPPVFRTGIWMHTSTAVQLAQTLVNLLPKGSITIPAADTVKEPD